MYCSVDVDAQYAQHENSSNRPISHVGPSFGTGALTPAAQRQSRWLVIAVVASFLLGVAAAGLHFFRPAVDDAVSALQVSFE